MAVGEKESQSLGVAVNHRVATNLLSNPLLALLLLAVTSVNLPYAMYSTVLANQNLNLPSPHLSLFWLAVAYIGLPYTVTLLPGSPSLPTSAWTLARTLSTPTSTLAAPAVQCMEAIGCMVARVGLNSIYTPYMTV